MLVFKERLRDPKVLASIVSSIVVSYVFFFTHFSDQLQKDLFLRSYSLEIWSRNILSHGEKVNQRLKVFHFDKSAKEVYGDSGLKVSELIKALNLIKKQNPKEIFVVSNQITIHSKFDLRRIFATQHPPIYANTQFIGALDLSPQEKELVSGRIGIVPTQFSPFGVKEQGRLKYLPFLSYGNPKKSTVTNNLSDFHFRRVLRSFANIKHRLTNRKPLASVDKDDSIILFIDSEATSRVNLQLAAAVNSNLESKWIVHSWPVSYSLFLASILSIMAFFWFFRSLILRSLAIAIYCGFILGLSAFSFSFSHLFFGSVFVLAGHLASGALAELIHPVFYLWRKKISMRLTTRMIPKDKQTSLLTANGTIKFYDYQGPCTIMSIWIEDAAVIAEKFPIHQSFGTMAHLEDKLIPIIHKYSGVTLGNLTRRIDVVFGYHFTQDDYVNQPTKVSRALHCAREIAYVFIQENLHAAENQLPIFPVKLLVSSGIHSLGNLDNSRLVLGLLGPSLAKADRLSETCPPNQIVYCEKTSHLLAEFYESDSPYSQDEKFTYRLPGQQDPQTAFIHDPHSDNAEDKKIITEALRKIKEARRVHERFELKNHEVLNVSTDHQSLQISSFSRHGLGLVSQVSYARGHILHLNLKFKNEYYNKITESYRIEQIVCEVRWTKKQGYNYYVGLMFLNLREEQKEILFECINKSQAPEHLRFG